MSDRKKPPLVFGHWSLSADRHNWTLIRRTTGKPVQTYHRDLAQVSNWVMNEDAKDLLESANGGRVPLDVSDHSHPLDALTDSVRASEASLTAALKEAVEGGKA